MVGHWVQYIYIYYIYIDNYIYIRMSDQTEINIQSDLCLHFVPTFITVVIEFQISFGENYKAAYILILTDTPLVCYLLLF